MNAVMRTDRNAPVVRGYVKQCTAPPVPSDTDKGQPPPAAEKDPVSVLCGGCNRGELSAHA